MADLSIIASVTEPSRLDRENEDRLGWNETAAFVVDGATSLGDPVVDPPRSDAAWLAEHAVDYFKSQLTAERTTAGVVRELNRAAATRFAEASENLQIERYRHPTAGFQSLRVTDKGIEVAGLGDCVLFLRDAEGTLLRRSALALKRSREQYFAQKALTRCGGFDSEGVAYQGREVLSDLRSRRAKHNIPGGNVWTLGLEPMAADYLAVSHLRITLPATALLCTDGFGDLVDAYARHTVASLIDEAETAGLRSLLEELRYVERQLDPDGIAFPRYKQSDDASAILLRLTE
jgi:Protein phosphatase 2C